MIRGAFFVIFFLTCTGCALFAVDDPPHPDDGGGLSVDPSGLDGLIRSDREQFTAGYGYDDILSGAFVFVDSRGVEWPRDEFLRRLETIQSQYDSTRVVWSGDSADYLGRDGAEYQLPTRTARINLGEDTVEESFNMYITYSTVDKWQITRWETDEIETDLSFFHPEYSD
ncbi:MAG: hypothetical protein ACQEQV_03735 [Fibrobacterota bacterium]